jgi:hypothetical protein
MRHNSDAAEAVARGTPPARQEDLQEQFDSAIGREGEHGEQRHSDASTSTAIIKDYLATGKAHLVMEVTGVLKD